MTPKSPSLTPYDFLGYIVPGLGFITLVDLSLLYHLDSGGFTYEKVCERYMNVKITGVIPILLFAYLVGHIVGFCSSVLIERHSTWMYGNPTRFLLNTGRIPSYFETGGGSASWSRFFRGITAAIILPISLLDLIFSKIIPLSRNYITSLDPVLVRASAHATANIMGKLGFKEIPNDKEFGSLDIHRLTVHCAIESAPNHVSSLRNYVVLYGFLRSISLILVGVFWVLVLHLNTRLDWWEVVLWTSMSAFASYILYAAFLKFRIRYHKEGIMAVIASYCVSTENRI